MTADGKPKSLEQREISDAIGCLSEPEVFEPCSKDCQAHAQMLHRNAARDRAMVLMLRIGESTLYEVERLKVAIEDRRIRWVRLFISPAVTAAIVAALLGMVQGCWHGRTVSATQTPAHGPGKP